MRYQVDKLVKTAVTGTVNASDPLNFKANPANLVIDDDDDDSDDVDSDQEKQKSKKKKPQHSEDENEDQDKVRKYVPPKHTPMPYDEDTAAEKETKLRERARKRALNSSLVDEWKEEFLDTPVEISGSSRAQQMIQKELKERERYEEDNFVRLPMTKEEKQRMKRLSTLGNLGDELINFGSGAVGNKKKRKLNSGGGKKKKGGKKRKFN